MGRRDRSLTAIGIGALTAQGAPHLAYGAARPHATMGNAGHAHVPRACPDPARHRTFRVPSEEDTASTTKVQVFLPTDHPVLGVLVSPRDGWSAKVTNTKLKTPVKTDDGTITDAVPEVTWTGGKIDPGTTRDFDVAYGQLPEDTGQLTFKTLQTYSDGKAVRWIEEAAQGDEEPENPAPVLKLTAKKPSDEADVPTASASPSKISVSAASDSSDSTARGLGVAGLVVGVLGLAAAAFAIVRGRSAVPGPSEAACPADGEQSAGHGVVEPLPYMWRAP
ncbi:YcnI family protein [Streptomyces griseoviridis]|uniref:YcnI family protein n=1 Tax=Streptomyces griseoviridis TaxID=45398 RepID=UPI003F56FDCA